MKIAHLSDLHISQKSKPNNLTYTRKLLEYALEEGVDHIVITGDLTDLGNPGDFFLLRKVFEEFNLLNPFKLSLVFGNHDIFGGVHLAKDILSFPKFCNELDYEERVNDSKSFFLETFENMYAPPPPDVFPYIKPIGDIIFIGLNSIARYSKIKNVFASGGKFYKKQLNDLDKLLRLNDHYSKKKIVLMHHHFERQMKLNFEQNESVLHKIERRSNRLRNKGHLLKLFKRYNIDLVLHGHEHESCEYWMNGLHLMNGGGCIDKNKIGELKINFISIFGDDIFTEVRLIKENTKIYSRKIFADTLILR